MDEAEAYVKRASKIRYQHFRGGYVSERDNPPVTRSGGAMAVPGHPGQQQQQAGSVLPPKKSKKRERSPVRGGEIPAPVTTLSTSGKARVSLMEKWFPGNTLKQATVETCHAPPAATVASTVQRITSARETMILLRSGVEDLEALLDELKPSALAKSATDTTVSLSPDEVKRLVTGDTASRVGEALAQCARQHGHSVHFLRRQLNAVMRRKARVAARKTPSVKQWHLFLNQQGPEAGCVPTTTDFLWLSSASTTAFFTVLVQRFLRGVRASTRVACGEVCEVDGADGHEGRKRILLDINDPEETELMEAVAEGGASTSVSAISPPLCWDREATLRDNTWLQQTQQRLLPHTGETPSTELCQRTRPQTDSQCQLLVFLRFLMPTTEHAASADDQEAAAGHRCCGYGAWVLACLAVLDTPLDPDTDRLVHDLFRMCCDQVRVIGEWKGVHGEQPGLLLAALRKEEEHPAHGAAPTAYTCLEDVGKPELLALYSLIIILAKLFRQNQNRLIPL